jgi:hypothetical protein
MENIEDVYNLYFFTIMIIHIDNQSDTKKYQIIHLRIWS